jgi:hypothetical protein
MFDQGTPDDDDEDDEDEHDVTARRNWCLL